MDTEGRPSRPQSPTHRAAGQLQSPVRSVRSSRSMSPKPGRISPAGSDASQKPVREKFKKTAISEKSTAADGSRSQSGSEAGEDDRISIRSDEDTVHIGIERGRIRRKRSFEEVEDHQGEDGEKRNNSKHARKTSVETHLQDSRRDEVMTGDASVFEPERVATPELHENADDRQRPQSPMLPTSPQGKRNRDQFLNDDVSTKDTELVTQSIASVASEGKPPAPTEKSSKAEDEPESKRLRDNSIAAVAETKNPTNATLTGFSNTSTSSPFSSIGSAKKSQDQPQTSAAAFAASGFASLAQSETSPFGSLSSEKSPSATSGFSFSKTDQKSQSGFGGLGTSSVSPFASAAASGPSVFGGGSTSGFGSLGNGATSGFASLGSSSTPLKSFAASSQTGIIGFGQKATKAFGASADNEEENEGDEADEDEEQQLEDNDEQDSRFYEQDMETGEENEVTMFAQKAKLFVSQDKQWKERASGLFKVNSTLFDPSGETKVTGRFVMRTEGSNRLMLNTPLKKEVIIEDPAGGKPKGKQAVFLAFVDGNPSMCLVRFGKAEYALQLREEVDKIAAEM